MGVISRLKNLFFFGNKEKKPISTPMTREEVGRVFRDRFSDEYKPFVVGERRQYALCKHFRLVRDCDTCHTAKALVILKDMVAEAYRSAGFCKRHKPDGYRRTCIVCEVERLSAALDKIDALVSGKPIDYKAIINEVRRLTKISRSS